MQDAFDEETTRAEIAAELARFVREDPANRLDLDGLPIFEAPIVGFAAGTDPLFTQLKTVIDDFHLTPAEAMHKAALGRGIVAPPEKSIGVVAFALPLHKETVRENAQMTDRPSRRWIHAKLYGEQFLDDTTDHLISFLRSTGHFAISPEAEPGFYTITRTSKAGYSSNWSQRHVAFAAGLGTFGLNAGLITKAGVAQELGSVVVDIPFSSPERREDVHGACLHYQKGTCRACVRRCPAQAISEAGHDKNKCAKFAFGQTPLNKERYGIETYGCGLCLTGVPCARRDPVNG